MNALLSTDFVCYAFENYLASALECFSHATHDVWPFKHCVQMRVQG